MAKAKRIGAKKTSSFNKGTHSLNPDRPKKSNDSTMRDKSTIKRLLMYKNSRPYRDRKGKIVKAAPYQSWVTSGTVARVAPNPKWFGNTRTVSQGALQQFQQELGQAMRDPYQVVMRQSKLPVSLLNEKAKNARVHILDTASYEATFGPKAQRKKPRISAGDLNELVQAADTSQAQHEETKKDVPEEEARATVRQEIMAKGQSKRIWNELYKEVCMLPGTLCDGLRDYAQFVGVRSRRSRLVKAQIVECAHESSVIVSDANVPHELSRPGRGDRLVGRGDPSAGRPGPTGHTQPFHRALHAQGETPQAPGVRAQQVRPGAHLGDSALGGSPLGRVPHHGIPRQHHEPFWQGRPHQSAQAVLQAAHGQAANQRGLHWLPQRWQVIGHQCLAL
ncbi:hypothetical protein HPB51_012204 [Rhipicephalus microplus]|uniref:Nucleolar GTP-binding protein 2 N-terminal domain-containing protein n=1 Tax=Rhipicephalus microplus TaxID=6941 RepID=A0A9J6E9U1_RHIMP|nr:hypothetical protein HPB51_012204 [Rhipicephalus microplus]